MRFGSSCNYSYHRCVKYIEMKKKRLLYLDNLKVCLTVLVIFHHAGQAYGDGGDWAYHPNNPA